MSLDPNAYLQSVVQPWQIADVIISTDIKPKSSERHNYIYCKGNCISIPENPEAPEGIKLSLELIYKIATHFFRTSYLRVAIASYITAVYLSNSTEQIPDDFIQSVVQLKGKMESSLNILKEMERRSTLNKERAFYTVCGFIRWIFARCFSFQRQAQLTSIQQAINSFDPIEWIEESAFDMVTIDFNLIAEKLGVPEEECVKGITNLSELNKALTKYHSDKLNLNFRNASDEVKEYVHKKLTSIGNLKELIKKLHNFSPDTAGSISKSPVSIPTLLN